MITQKDSQPSKKHTITFSDGGLCGFSCGDNHSVGMIDEQGATCPICGQEIELHWEVYLIDKENK